MTHTQPELTADGRRIAGTSEEAAVYEAFGTPYVAHFGPAFRAAEQAKADAAKAERDRAATAEAHAARRGRESAERHAEASARHAETAAKIAEAQTTIRANRARIAEVYDAAGVPEMTEAEGWTALESAVNVSQNGGPYEAVAKAAAVLYRAGVQPAAVHARRAELVREAHAEAARDRAERTKAWAAEDAKTRR